MTEPEPATVASQPEQALEPWSDGLVERLHGRLGDRYLTFLLVCLALAIISLSASLGILAVPYLGLSGREYLRSAVVWLPWMCVVAVASALAHARVIAPLRVWIRSGRPSATAPTAWHAAVTSLPRAVMTGGAIAQVGVVSVAGYLVHDAGHFGAGGLLAAIAGTSLVALAATAGIYLIWERALRPVVLDVLAHLPADFRTERMSLSLSRRLLMVVPITNVSTALIATAAVRDGLTPSQKIVLGVSVAIAITVLVALPLTLMLRRSLLGPMAQMLTAMGRVERGDFTARLRVITGDELGIIAQHFNSMVGGLERLSGDNANLQARVKAQLEQVVASRARTIVASDAERRRVERNLHDGAQQRLVALALELRLLEHQAGSTASPELLEGLSKAGASLSDALAELTELARGLHPQILRTDGLAPAIKQLAARAPVPVLVSVSSPKERFPDPIESTIYFVVCEALANVAKYSKASKADVSLERRGRMLRVAVTDDGVGGADASAGSGLSGLTDRVAALDGRLSVMSPVGEGTQVRAELPLNGHGGDQDQY